MLTVYAIPVSLYCAKLRIVLRHKALEWNELPPPGGYRSDEYKQIVPSGNLPALADGGLLIADSEAIAEYLNEKHAEPPMLPAEPAERAKVRERSRFHDTRLEPEVRTLFAHMPESGRDEAVLANRSHAISARLAHLGRMIEAVPPKPEHGLTLADCGFPVTFAWLDGLTPKLGLEIAWPEAVTAYRTGLEEHDAIAAELAEYGPRLKEWLIWRAEA